MFESYDARETAETRGLLAQVSSASRAENRAAAARLVAVGELWKVRLRECGSREDWVLDAEAAVGAEVAAELRISQGLAGSYLRYAQSLERLPAVAEVFVAGEISYPLFQTIVYRTDLITDPDTLAAVDAELAVLVPRWPSLTRKRLAARIDKIVWRADRDAVRRQRKSAVDGRDLWIADRHDGLSDVTAVLLTPHAHAFGKKLAELAATVCEHDPRTVEARRADAVDVLVAGGDRMGCRCGRPDCPAGSKPPAGSVVIHVIAESAGLSGQGDAPGSLVGGDGLIPAEVLAELAHSARCVPLIHPLDRAPEPGYTPSRALADFVRCRDLTCRFPGCDRPAAEADIDHTVPHGDGGVTQASNLKCLCRFHHLIKTFWGWKDSQLADGTVIWTSPGGQRYVTTPGSALLFPALCVPTAGIASPEAEYPQRCGDRGAMMPRRRRTRTQNRAAAVEAERRRNRAERPPARSRDYWLGMAGPYPDDGEPPPF
ncbi:MAG: HNH endonuclease signature motif containing protein [Actinomycetota bacterium]|nr:HNH endonuclease signature motif containing protein [Actinomycetota bacterium]